MPKFMKKPIIVDATPWLKNGDHPLDVDANHPEGTEGAIVRYYRSPEKSGTCVCEKCSKTMNEHGWIDTLEGGHIVCPGDFIITGIQGEHYPCKPDIFAATYDKCNAE